MDLKKHLVGYLVFAAWQEFAANFDGATEETWAPRRSNSHVVPGVRG